MKKWIVISGLLALLLAGCGGKAAPVDPALTIDGVTFTPRERRGRRAGDSGRGL